MAEKLPPGTLCVVCQDLATGNHYSRPSCNGCKTFFRRAIVKNRTFACMGNGNCPVNKGVRCACRHCRFKKCLEVGMDRNSIQNDRDRIGYTKRTRKADKLAAAEKKQKVSTPPGTSDDEESSNPQSPIRIESGADEHSSNSPLDLISGQSSTAHSSQAQADPLLDRLTVLENNFTLLLSRGQIEPYGSLDHALASPSLFNRPIDVKVTDPIAAPKPGTDKPNLPFWRSRIIALYIDWAKTFSAFKNLPYSDKVALITNHASSYMVMCEAFRTPEHSDNVILNVDASMVAKNAEITKKEPWSPAVIVNGSDSGDGQLQQSFRRPNIFEYSAKSSCPNPIDLDAFQNGVITDSAHWTSVASKSREQPQNDSVSSKSDSQLSIKHEFLKPGFFDDNGGGTSAASDRPSAAHCASLGSLSGLTPVMTAMIDYVMKPFRRLNISTTEFAVLQAIMFFDPDTDGLDSASQRNVTAEQKKLLAALYRYLRAHYEAVEADDRYAAILLCIPTIRKVAAKKNESLQIIDMFKIFELNSLLKETALGIRSPNAILSPVANSVADDIKMSIDKSG